MLVWRGHPSGTLSRPVSGPTWLFGAAGVGLGVMVGSADALGSAMPAANSRAPIHAAVMLMNFFMEITTPSARY